jgi:hypothetical protein
MLNTAIYFEKWNKIGAFKYMSYASENEAKVSKYVSKY